MGTKAVDLQVGLEISAFPANARGVGQALARTSGAAGLNNPVVAKHQQGMRQDQRLKRFPFFRVRYLLVAIVLVWAGYHYFAVQLPQYQALKSQEATLTKQLHTLQAKHQQLQKQETELKDPAYILQYAAKKYNLVAPGQVAFNVQK